MEYLYESSSLADVKEMVANLFFVSQMGPFDAIVTEDEECVAAASDDRTVFIFIGF